MITRLVKMHFNEEHIDDFLALFDDVKVKIRSQKGCNYLELLQDTNEPSMIMTYSIWDSEDDLNNYRKSELFGETWKKTKSLFKDKPQANSFKSLNKLY